MKKKLLILMLLFSCAYLSVARAQGPNDIGTYKYSCTRNAYGDVIEDVAHPQKVMAVILSTNFLGICQSGLTYCEQGVSGIWPSVGMDFTYAGASNGWYIFKQDLGMMGISFIYVAGDYSRIRVKMSFYNGNYREYVRWSEQDDIDYLPIEYD